MNMVEYINLYERKTHEKYYSPDYVRLWFDKEHGFCQYDFSTKYFFIFQMCGDMRYWIDEAKKFCKSHSLISISAGTKRNPKAFARRLGFNPRTLKNDKGEVFKIEKLPEGWFMTMGVK